MADNPNDPNNTLNRRRDERSKQLLQEGASRMTDLTASGLDVNRSIITWWATAAACYAETLHNVSHSMGQMIEQTEHMTNQIRRSA